MQAAEVGREGETGDGTAEEENGKGSAKTDEKRTENSCQAFLTVEALRS